MVQLQVPDRMYFEQYQVNGITVYQRYNPNTSHTKINVVLPLGLLYTQHGFGAPHVLEHMVLGYSKEDRSRHHALWNDIDYAGGKLHASINAQKTTFEAKMLNTTRFTDLQRRFAIQIFHPLFDEYDLEEEKKIIHQEIAQRKAFYPSGKESVWYTEHKWCEVENADSKITLGTPEDIESISTEKLYDLHRAFFSSQGSYIIVSGGSIQPFLDELKQISFTEPSFPRRFLNIYWKNPQYQEVAVEDLTSQHCLHMATIYHCSLTAEIVTAYELLNMFLIHSQLGILQPEYTRRQNLVLSFNGKADAEFDNGILFTISGYAHNKSSLASLKSMILEFIESQITSERLNQFVDNIQFRNLAKNERPESQVKTAWEDLQRIQTIRTSSFKKEIAEKFRHPAYVLSLWKALAFHFILFSPKSE